MFVCVTAIIAIHAWIDFKEISTQVVRRQILVEFDKGKNCFNIFKMASILNI